MRDALGNVQSVLVFGGGSDIALATVRHLVERRTTTVVLAALHPDRLEGEAAALHAAGATTVEVVPFDARDTAAHEPMVDDLFDRFGDFDVVIVAFGILGDKADAQQHVGTALETARVNYVGTISVTMPVVRRLQAQGHGTIIALSSVAAERARRKNFVYGSSKAGMDAFLQGLSDRMAGSAVRVMVVRPGFVHTKMTAGLDPAPLATTVDEVAEAIIRGLAKGSQTVWIPGVMRWIMSVLRHLPRFIFRRLSI